MTAHKQTNSCTFAASLGECLPADGIAGRDEYSPLHYPPMIVMSMVMMKIGEDSTSVVVLLEPDLSIIEAIRNGS